MTDKLNDLLPTTPDVQAERLAELKRLFPDLFDGEGQLKLDEIKQLTGDEPQCRERYDFSWYGKRKSKEAAYTPTTATLSYDEARSINPDKADGNLIIEGENLESLKTLLSAYRESIKCIYIDPPYNTGNDFVYSDNYSEEKRAYWEETGGLEKGVKVDTNPETAGRYHSNWLSMMYSRLLLARQLLKDDGVIFVSIDDNEVHNLRRLMDDVFGEENFVGQFIWKRRASSAMADNNVSFDQDYVISYQKGNIEGFGGVKKDYSKYSNKDNDARGDWVLGDLTVGMTASMRPNQAYDLIDPKTGISYPFNPNRVWAYIPESMNKMIVEGRVVFPNEKNKRPMQKRFKDELKGTHNPLSTLLLDKVGLNTEATKTIQDVLGGNVFDYSKPVSLLTTLISQICRSGDYVLDFFSGSGVTAQAICELNAKDNGSRKFILVQLPEQTPEKSEAKKAGYNKISDITIERVKRVIQGYGDNPQPLDTGFKVYQLTKSHFPRTEFKPDPEKSEAENIEVLKTYIAEKEKQLTGLFEATEIQDEVLLKNGFKLNYQLSDASEFKSNKIKLADDGEKQSLLCLDSKLNPETVKQLIKEPQAFICLERALSTDDKWNLRQHLKHEFVAF